LRLLKLLGDLVFAIGGGNAGEAGSSGVEGIVIGSTYSWSSKSVEFDDIGSEKSIAALSV
jgi:hypothetical protein